MTTWACSSCGGENPDAMRFCGHCGAATTPDSTPDVSGTLRSFVAQPVAERLVEAGGELPEERRLITALFADVSGFTALADRLDPEELLEVIDPVISGLSSAVGRYEGYVEKFAGDALLALFGAPVTHEDDAERALLTALEMHRELAQLCKELPYDAELTLHCGVNSGHGIARILGSEARMDYAVLGDSVILAQRLESAAPKGETYVSDLTYRLTSHRFEFEPVGELQLKGKSEPVPAWRLLRELPASLRVTVVRSLVGRTRELGTVLGAIRGAETGTPVVLVTGEPGVGKSRLTEAAREQAEEGGARWLQTRCLSYGAGLAYWPYAELLRTTAGLDPQLSPEEARDALLAAVQVESALPYFARLLGLPAGDAAVAELEPDAFRRGLHDAYPAWLESLAHERAVLAIEDLHWADPSSLELTAELSRRDSGGRLALYLTGRPEAEQVVGDLALDVRHLRLEPLGREGVEELIRETLDGNPPPELVPWAHARTTGNPFFVGELVRALRERHTLVAEDGVWKLAAGWAQDDIPPTVEGLLASRIDLLPRPAADLLQTASVIGRVVRVPLLTAIRQNLDPARELEALLARGFLDRVADEGEETLSFHHALVQDVAYSRLLRRQRRDLHLRVAEAAEAMYGAGDDVVDLLARHLYLGEAGTKAVDYLVRAGERARALYANEEAIVHLGRAAELVAKEPGTDARRTEISLALADLHDLVGRYEEAIRLYEGVREATSDLRAWRGLAAAHRKRGEYERALAVVDEAMRQEALAGADFTSLWLEQGATLSTAGHFDEAIDVLGLALATAEVSGNGQASSILIPLARAELMAGKLEDARAHAVRAQESFDAGGDLRSLSSTSRLLGDIHSALGRVDEAVATLERGLELAQRTGNVEEVGGCLINLGIAEIARERWEAAAEHNRRAIVEFERIGHGTGRALGYSNLAFVHANMGDLEAAQRYCEQAIDLSRSIGHQLVLAETTDTMALILKERGALEEAVAQAEEAARLFLDLGAAPKAAQALELAASALEADERPEQAREARSRARSLR